MKRRMFQSHPKVSQAKSVKYGECEQIDPCSGLSLLSAVPVMLIAPGNLSAWHADSVLIFLARDLSQYGVSMHNHICA